MNKMATIYLNTNEFIIIRILDLIPDYVEEYAYIGCYSEGYIKVTGRQLSDILYFMWEKGFVGHTADKLRDKLNQAGINIFGW